jgi:hypothetical protein
MTTDKVMERAFDPRVGDDDPEVMNALRAIRRRCVARDQLLFFIDRDGHQSNPLLWVVEDKDKTIAELRQQVTKLEARLKRIQQIARDK